MVSMICMVMLVVGGAFTVYSIIEEFVYAYFLGKSIEASPLSKCCDKLAQRLKYRYYKWRFKGDEVINLKHNVKTDTWSWGR